MSVSVQQSGDEPIVVFSFEGMLDRETIDAVNAEAYELLEQMGTYYAIVDIRSLEITYGEVRALFENADAPSIFVDERVTPVFVGRSIPNDPTNQEQLPVFTDREAATDYIRQTIAKK